MNIWVCDCCGKQIDRFARSYKYEINKKSKDRNDRAFYTRPLEFCTPCRQKIESFLERTLKNLPEKVEVSLSREE